MANFLKQIGSAVGLGGSKAAPSVAPQQIDSRYANTVAAGSKLAKDYKSGLADTQQQKYGVAADSGRRALATSLASADKTANRRGMLYGGVRGGLRANAESDQANELANKRREINLETQGNLDDMETNALGSAFGLRSDVQGTYDDAYNQALSRRQEMINKQGDMYGALGQGVGGLVGSGALDADIGGMLGGSGGKKITSTKNTTGASALANVA